MKIVLFGATGLVGSKTLELLKDTGHDIHLFSRSPIKNISKEISQYINKDILAETKKNLALVKDAQWVICTLGTTIKKAGSKDKFIAIDKTLPLSLFKLFDRESKIILVSAKGANKDSLLFYNQVKGQLEYECKKLPNKINIIRPSLIIGERKEKRTLEEISQKVLSGVEKFVPKSMRHLAPHSANLIANEIFNILSNNKLSGEIEVELND